MPVWLTFRSLLRTRWRAWLGLAVLVGVTAGGVMGAAAAARRTANAHDRFRERHRAYDALVVCDSGAGGSPPVGPIVSGCADEVRRLPSVADLTVVQTLSAYIATADGRSVQPIADDPCYSGPGLVAVVGDQSNRFGVELNESRIVAGRRADPATTDEVVLSKSTADRLGIGPGSTLKVSLFGRADCLSNPAEWDPPLTLRVVGIGLAPGEIAPPSGEYFASVQVTPAFLAALPPTSGHDVLIPVRLRAGVGVEALRADLADLADIGRTADVIVDMRDLARAVDRGIWPQAVALAVIAGLAALAGAAVIGQALARVSRADGVDRPTFTALGMNRRQHVAVSIVAAMSLGITSAAIGAIAAVATSALTPIGLAGDIEPDPGLLFDATTTTLGAAVTVAFVIVVIGARTWWSSPVTFTRARPVRGHSGVSDGLARAGFPTTMVAGVRMALSRGTERGAVPVFTSVAAIAVAIFTVAGSITFGAGIAHVLDTPRLRGANWDGLLLWPEVADQPVEQQRLEAVLSRHADVTAFTTGTFFAPFGGNTPLRLGPERREVPMISFEGDGDVGPSVIEGRPPVADDEVLIGPETLDELALGIGDTVVAYGRVGSFSEQGAETTLSLRIVGMGVVPAAGGGGRLGRGASMTLGGVIRLNPMATADGVWLRFSGGDDASAVVDSVLHDLGAAPIGSGSDFLGPAFFSSVLDIREVEQVRRAPEVFAVLMGMMALGVTAHVLTGALHANRLDLAVLRALGFRRKDVGHAVAWQSTVYLLLALAAGAPVGVAVGRIAWRAYSERLGVVPEPVVPWLSLTAISVATLVVAALVALALSRRATSRDPATALRAE